MDLKGVAKKNKRRLSSNQDANSKSKTIRPSTRTRSEAAGSTTEAERCLAELLTHMKPVLSDLVQEEVKKMFDSHFRPLLESLRERKETGEEEVITSDSEVGKFKLIFLNEIAPTIFTNNQVRDENGEPIRVAIFDATTNETICTGILSSAQIELFVLDGEYGSGQEENESELNKYVLSPRDGKRPLMVGNHQKLALENGVGLVKDLCITDNSSWIKNKKFRIGVKIRDEKILVQFPNVGVAVSQPFRVMDHRGEMNKKHHPPSREDEVWRLEGIGKDGAYHKNLSYHGITTVGDFLEAYRDMGADPLRRLLGIKVPKKTWMMMIDNAFECVTDPTYNQSSEASLLGNQVVGNEAFNESYQAYEQGGDLSYDFDLLVRAVALNEESPYYEGSLPFYRGEASTSYGVATQALKPNSFKDLGSS